MSVRAKFKVNSIERSKFGEKEMQTIKMSPVYSDDPESENKKFWDASPSGELQLGCVNLQAAQQFELGGEYYLDFIKAT